MRIDADGFLDLARVCLSPNVDDRPETVVVDLLVVHCISLPPGEYGGSEVESFFCNQLDTSLHPYFKTIKGLRVSAHFLINRLGEITQFTSVNRRAWHAGKSAFEGQENCNDYSVGIELEGSEETAYTARQYEVLAQLADSLMVYFPGITAKRIVGHSDIAPGRKTDPGPAFNWATFRSKLG